MSEPYTRQQIYDAIRKADAAGDGNSVRKLLAELDRMSELESQQNPNAPLRSSFVEQDARDKYSESQPSTLEQLGSATQNVVAGVAEGAASLLDFPLDVADTVNSAVDEGIRLAGTGAFNALGMEGEASRLNQTIDLIGQRRADRVRAADLVQQASPTPPGGESARFAAQLLGGLAVPGPKTVPRARAPQPAASSAAQSIIDEGAKRGVRVMTSDVRQPRGFTSKMMQATGERIPYAGTGGARVAQMEERIKAVRDLAKEFGAEGIENYIEGVAEDFIKTRGKALTTLKTAKDSVIQSIDAPFTDAPNTIKAISEQVRRLQGIDAREFAPVIERLQRFGQQATSGKTLGQIEGQRRLLSEMFEDASLAAIKTDGQKAVNAIYAPLVDDMASFIKAQAGEAAYSKWAGANKRLSQMVGDLSDGAFKRALNGADTTPEKVANLLFSKNPSEVKRLYRSLSASGRTRAKSAVISRAMEKAVDGEILSPAKFRSEIERLSSPIGVIFDKADKASVEGLSRLLQATQRSSVSAAAPPTGVQNVQIIGASFLTDLMGGMGGATTSAIAAGFAARAYESATVRNLMINLGKTKPGSKAESATLARIEGVLASQASLKSDDLRGAINDNAASQLAAENQ